MTIKQVETAVAAGTVTGTGNATITVTANGMTNSPKAISVAVSSGDTASIVGGLIRTALAFDVDVAALFLVSGSGANVVLTKHVAAANDDTLNIAIANGTCTGLTAAPTSTNTTAGTGLTNGYCTMAQVKHEAIINKATTTASDETIEIIVEAVSRLIDNKTARFFYNATQTRYYTADEGDYLFVDDISSSSGLTIYTDEDGDGVYENTWASTDYNLVSYNSSLDGWPFQVIETTPEGNYSFPRTKKGVKIIGPFGWAATPKTITLACLLQSNREYRRFDTPLGQAGASAVGVINLSIPALDPDVEKLICPYVRMT
jgi:hypothetical protein